MLLGEYIKNCKTHFSLTDRQSNVATALLVVAWEIYMLRKGDAD